MRSSSGRSRLGMGFAGRTDLSELRTDHRGPRLIKQAAPQSAAAPARPGPETPKAQPPGGLGRFDLASYGGADRNQTGGRRLRSCLHLYQGCKAVRSCVNTSSMDFVPIYASPLTTLRSLTDDELVKAHDEVAGTSSGGQPPSLAWTTTFTRFRGASRNAPRRSWSSRRRPW
jgi:hypothetical protein